MEEQIKEAIEIAKLAVKATTEDKEIFDLVALAAKLYFDAFIEQGFSVEQAILLTASSIKNK